MIILHICSITNNKTSGISNVVPEHFLNQMQYAKVGLLNCDENRIDKLNQTENVFNINDIKNKDISYLPYPFNKPNLVVFHGIYIINYVYIARNLIKENIPYIVVPHGSLASLAQQKKI